MEHEYLIFPIKDPRGFEVNTVEDYQQLIMAIGRETIDLAVEFPDKICWVVYETEQGTN